MKVYGSRHGFEVERKIFEGKGKIFQGKQQAEIFLVHRLPTYCKFDCCFQDSKKEQKRHKIEFVTKFVGIIVMIIFTKTYLSNCW